MSTKEEWQDTGKALGGAFKKLAKTSIRSVAAGIQAAEKWADDLDKEAAEGDTITVEAKEL